MVWTIKNLFFILLLSANLIRCTSVSNPAPSTSSSFALKNSLTLNYDTNTIQVSITGNITGPLLTPLTELIFYTEPTCTKENVGKGSVTDFLSTGILLNLPSNQKSTLYFTANSTQLTNNDNNCSYASEYLPDIPNPEVPTFLATNPGSPSPSVTTPVVIGLIGGHASQIQIFSDSDCLNKIGEDTVNNFKNQGVQITVPENQTTSIYGQSVEPFGKKSKCQLLTTYTIDPSSFLPPVYTKLVPTSPSNSTLNPSVFGTSPSALSTQVFLFSDSACTIALANDTKDNFATTGIKVSVLANYSTSIYGYAADDNGKKSACNYIATYTSDTIPPTQPTFTSVTPSSPTRLTTLPVLKGTSSSDTIFIKFYNNPICTQSIGTGTRSAFTNSGITISIPENSTTSIYAAAFDNAGNSSKCTYMLDFVNNTLKPDVPTYDSTSPVSPNNITATPQIFGGLPPAAVSVQFSDDSNCSNIIGSGTAAQFINTSVGIKITTVPNTDPQIYAQSIDNVGNISDCTPLTTYQYSNIRPPQPIFNHTNPTTPSNSSSTPFIIGSNVAKLSTVNLFNDNQCTNLIANDSGTAFTQGGIRVSLPQNSTMDIYSTVIDVFGNTSLCTYLTTYTHDTTPPAAPVFTTISPASPNNQSSTPAISGTTSADTVLVRLYDSSSCSSMIGSGNSNTFNSGITVTAPANRVFSIYAKSFDAANNSSACTPMTNYTYATNPPGTPSYSSVTPITVNNIQQITTYSMELKIIGSISTSSDMMPVSSVGIYSNSSCNPLTLLNSAPLNQFTSTGIVFDVMENNPSVNTLFAQSVDSVGNKSPCNHLIDLFQNDLGPTNVSATMFTNGAVNLNWDPDSNADYYQVKRSNSPNGPYIIISPIQYGTSFSDHNVVLNTTYYYTIASINSTGASKNSANLAYTIINPAPPNAPTGLSAIADNNKVLLSWQKDNSQSQFYVYRATQPGGPYLSLGGALNSAYYNDTSVVNNVVYYYIVRGFNPAGLSGYSNEVSIEPLSAPPAPTDLEGHWDPVIGGYVLSWTIPPYYSEGSLQFNIKRSSSLGGFQTISSVTVPIAVMSSYSYKMRYVTLPGTSTNINPNYYVVTAIWGSGSTESPNSNTVGIANINGPSLYSLAGNSEVYFTWNDPIGATNYTLYKSLTPGGPYQQVGSPTTNSYYTDSGLTNGVTYYYVLKSYYTVNSNDIYGPYSAELSVTPQAFQNIAPNQLTAIQTTNDLLQLSWSPPSQYDGFKIHYSTTSDFASDMLLANNFTPAGNQTTPTIATSSKITVNSVAINGLFYYRITSVWGTVESSASNIVSYCQGFPATLSATGNSTNISLSWPAVTGAVSYNLFRATNLNGPYTNIKNNVPTQAFTVNYSDTTATTGTPYFYSVSANFSNCSAPMSTNIVQGAVAGALSSSIPTGLRITGANQSYVTLNWNKVPGATNYKILYGYTPGGPYTNTQMVAANVPPSTVTVTGLNSYKAIYFVVQSYYGSSWSGSSNEVSTGSITTMIAGPNAIPGNGVVSLSWSTNYADSYTVYRGTDGINFSPLAGATNITAVTYNDNTVTNGTLYFYKILPIINGAALNFFSPISSVTPGTVPPNPTGLKLLENTTGTSLILTWNNMQGVTGYSIKKSTTSGGPYTTISSPPGSDSPGTIGGAVNVNGLTPGTTYYFVVSSMLGNVESAGNSNEIGIIPQAPPTAPTVTMTDTSTIQIQWNTVNYCAGSPAQSYALYRSKDSVNFDLLASSLIPSGSVMTYNDQSFTNNLTYYYKYLPMCTGNVPTSISLLSDSIATGVAPLTPLNLTLFANNSSPSILNLNWNNVPNAIKYTIYESSSSNGTYSIAGTIAQTPNTPNAPIPPVTFKTLTRATPGVYCYKISATNFSNNESSLSNAACINNGLAVPLNLTATAGNNNIQLQWNSSAGAVSYSVKRSPLNIGPFSILTNGNQINSVSLLDSTAIPGETYYYVVNAIDSNGYASADSALASAVPYSLVNLSFPVELTDQRISSDITKVIFENTRTHINPADYDGTVSYSFELVGTNTGAQAVSIQLVNSSNTAVGTINIPSGTTQNKRFSTALTSFTIDDNYRVSIGATAVADQVMLSTTRIWITQTNASRTKIYIPLLSSSANTSSHLSNNAIETSNSNNLSILKSSSLFLRDTSHFVNLLKTNPWTLETLVSTTQSQVYGQIAMYDMTQAQIAGPTFGIPQLITETTTEISGTQISLGEAAFNDGVVNFDSNTELHSYQLGVICTLNCSKGNLQVHKAGIWIGIENLMQARVSIRNALASTINGNAYIDTARTYVDLSKFSNPIVNYNADVDQQTNTSNTTVALYSDTTFDTGITNPVAVPQGSIIFPAPATSITRAITSTTLPITLSSFDRFYPYISGATQPVLINNTSVTIDISP